MLAFAYHYEDSTDTPNEIVSDTDIDWTEPPCNPDDLGEQWKETTHEKMAKYSNRREFVFKDTGIKIAFDKGVSGAPGFKGIDHWHRYNPNSVGNQDYYLDKNGKPTHKNSPKSHINSNCPE